MRKSTGKTKPRFENKNFLSVAGVGRTIWPYQQHAVIFSQGDPASSLLYIQKGKVKITVLSKGGKEAIIAILSESDFFGEGCLAGPPLRISTATAITECSIMRLERATVMEMLHKEAAFAELLLAYTLSRTIRIEEDLVDQLFNSSEKRLARALLLLANFGKEGKPETVIPTISQETLAEMIGTTRSREPTTVQRVRRTTFPFWSSDLFSSPVVAVPPIYGVGSRPAKIRSPTRRAWS